MKSFLLLITCLCAWSCRTERHYFAKALSKGDKSYLNDHDSLVKKFSGKANWYKQYWTGDILVRKNHNSFEIKKVGEWRQTSKDRQELYTIANFDQSGYIIDEKILGDEGMPPTGETHCKKDTVNGQVRLTCEVINRYQSGQLKEKGQRIIVGNKATKEGKWEYYTETGSFNKAINYHNDNPER